MTSLAQSLGSALIATLAVSGCGGDPKAAPLTPHVDPFIGTDADGHTFPGAVVPWGMVSVSPHNVLSEPGDYIAGRPIAPAGYRFGEPELLGLGLTHLSGVGCPELGVPVIAATTGEVVPGPDGYASAYAREEAAPGRYAVELVDHGVLVEATATARVGLLRFTFPERQGDANVLIDVGQGVSWHDGEGEVRVVASDEVEGSSTTGLFCAKGNQQPVFFVARFSRKAAETGTWVDGVVGEAPAQTGDAGAFLRFATGPEEVVEVRVGLSYGSVAGARANLDAEAPPERTFAEIEAAADAAWEAALSRIRVRGGTEAERTMFYSALYHTLIHPGIVSDVTGEHPKMGGGVGTADEPRHSVFSMWDTYRGVHPLLTLVYPEQQLAMVRSLAAMTAESGAPPMWELIGQEVQMMVGDPAAIVVAGSYLNGITDFDVEAMYAVMKGAALDEGAEPHRVGNASYRALGYVPMEEAGDVWGPVSTTLEYAYADAALSRLALALGHADDAALFAGQAQTYTRLFDPETGLLRPKNADGSWYAPFDPDALTGSAFYMNSGGPGYVEGTAWNYAFFVPHDVPGLVALHGGPERFVARLQAQFDDGKFALWNEPDLAFPYLFTYAEGEAHRTQEAVRAAMAAHFSARPDGIPGNDDAGALSAWYVFSAMGLYPDDPVSGRYSLGSPIFDRVEIDLHPDFHGGDTFVIEAERGGPDDIYVADMTLNGAPHAEPFLTHAQVTAGGVLRLGMARAP